MIDCVLGRAQHVPKTKRKLFVTSSNNNPFFFDSSVTVFCPSNYRSHTQKTFKFRRQKNEWKKKKKIYKRQRTSNFSKQF